MARFVEVANVEDVPPGTATVARVGDIEVAVVNVQGTFFAIDNECTHRDGFLGEGEINTDWSDWTIECPLHGSVLTVPRERVRLRSAEAEATVRRSTSTG